MDEDSDGESADGHAFAPPQVTAPHTLSLGDPQLEAGNVADPIRSGWRSELSKVGGRSPLLHFIDAPWSHIELSAHHPGGLAQFITGRTTMLSSLIRDEVALRRAKKAAALVAAKGLELATARGIDAIHLGIGMAEWNHDDESFRAPILLRPLAIRRHGRDFEVKLRGHAFLNPELARALGEQFELHLDADAFVALTNDDGAFKPNPVIDRLRGLTSHLAWFNVEPRLLIAPFADVATSLVADAANLEHPVLDALAGNASARWNVEEALAGIDGLSSDERPPQTDTLLLDADAEQEAVIAHIAAGNSVVVRTLPGTGGTQTIVNAIGALVAQNKRVLVVGARRAALHGITDRLVDVGLPGLAVSPSTLRRDIIRSISRSEKARKPQVGDVDDALVRLRKVLLDYRGALSKPDPVLGISVLDCVTELSRLALLPTPPATTARLNRDAVESLATGRREAARVMVDAARLGEFKYGPGDSPWYGAQFASGEAAASAHDLAKQLHDIDVPRLLAQGERLVAATTLRPYDSITELGVYLQLLVDVRDTLDRFLPAVFDRSLSELIIATAPRAVSREMPRANRRRLKKLAREYVRPGVHVGDMHDSLMRIQQQRILWQRFSTDSITPEVPLGIADARKTFARVAQGLDELDAPLGNVTRESELTNLPIARLRDVLAGLAEDSDVLHNLQERSELMSTLRSRGLDSLISDLAVRHVPEGRVESELELAWWQSALESLLAADRALLNANTTVLDRLEADFRLVDEAHAAGSAQLLSWQVADTWKVELVDWPDEAQKLKALLGNDRVTSASLQAVAPHLSRTVAPVWLASPYEVPSIADTIPFDTVILVDAGASTVAENLAAIRRGRQVVAFGDPVTQTPAPFGIAIGGHLAEGEPSSSDLDALHEDSALARLSELLPTLVLTRSYRAGGEDLAEFVNRRFYGGKIASLPWAGTFLGHNSLTLDYVNNGHGMPDPETGAVESVDAEVKRVVELVLDHAEHRPHESLMVMTASPRHAVRVEQAVLNAVALKPALSDFVIGDRAEPFAVVTVDHAVAQSRDRVIFSIGFGRTPHGRVLSNFGMLGEPGGDRLLAVAMTRARRSMVIVTCVEPADLDATRMKFGAVSLSEILAEVGARTAVAAVSDNGDPLLVDLARRLSQRGLRVALGHRGKLGLVVANGGICATIETDSVLNTQTLRESLRLRPEFLRRLGWHYVRVHAFELFSDPEAVATRIAAMLGVERPSHVPLPARAEPESSEVPEKSEESEESVESAVSEVSPATEPVDVQSPFSILREADNAQARPHRGDSPTEPIDIVTVD